MIRINYRDILGGLSLILIGTFIAIHSIIYLNLGTVSQMGSGMLPAALGIILAVLGLVIAIPAFFNSGEMPRIDLSSFLAISASIFVFAIMLRPFGLVPAIFGLTLVASRADSRLSLKGVVMVATGLSVLASLTFVFGLGLPIALFALPW